MSAIVARAAAAMLVLSFVMSSNANVLPQLYFQRHAPAQKLTWLAVSLLCATVASFAGVLASRARSRSAARAMGALFVAMTAEAALPRAPSAIVFVGLAAVAQFTVNYALNAIDHRAIERCGEARAAHDRASTAARLLGMLTAPLVIPLVIDAPRVLFACVAVMATIALAAAAGVVGGEPTSSKSTGEGASSLEPMSALDRRVLGFSLTVYVSLYLVAANLIYLLRDVARVANAERVGGTTLTIVFFGALVGAALRPKLLGTRSEPPAVAHLLAPLPWLAIVPAALSSGWSVPLAALAIGGLALGASYGVFLAALREHVSHGAGAQKRGALLSAFNNLANASSLVAFVLLAIAAVFTGGRTSRAYPFVMTFAALLPFAGSALLVRARPSGVPRNEAP